MGMGVAGMLIFFALLVLVGFVAAKFRAECGLPWGYMAPGNFALFMTLLGGISLFGPQMMMFCFIASFMLAPTVFFLIPGAQLELIELGQRWRVKRSHLLASCMMGIIGGVVIGGWVFLSNAYAIGGERFRYNWAFDTKWWYFFPYNVQMNAATNAWLGTRSTTLGGIDPSWWAYIYSAGGTLVATLLRWAGFWFHPIGFVLGSTNFMDYIWGSALAAWIIRGVVLRLGGAAAVRNKLQPLFIGVFLGAAMGELLVGVHGTYLRYLGIERIFPVLAP